MALLLGVMCGFGGLVLRHSLDFSRRLFLRLRLNTALTLALGGLVVGCIGLYLPETWGNGFEVIQKYAEGPTAALIVTLFLGKLVATCATIGSGGLGGIFTPNLVIGAAFGALFAFGCTWSPVRPRRRGSRAQIFAFVGMAGLTAATMHAPVTSVVLVFELTRHYELTLPVMLCSIVASITASLLDEDSYYTAAIKQKGEELPGGIEDMAIRTTFVRDVLRRDCVTVRDTAGFTEVMQLLGSHRGDTIYVQNGSAPRRAHRVAGREELPERSGPDRGRDRGRPHATRRDGEPRRFDRRRDAVFRRPRAARDRGRVAGQSAAVAGPRAPPGRHHDARAAKCWPAAPQCAPVAAGRRRARPQGAAGLRAAHAARARCLGRARGRCAAARETARSRPS
jgi:hypothetical protein